MSIDQSGDQFYIILQGTVSVLVPNPDVKDFQKRFNDMRAKEKEEEERKKREALQAQDTLNKHKQSRRTSSIGTTGRDILNATDMEEEEEKDEEEEIEEDYDEELEKAKAKKKKNQKKKE